MYMVSVEREFIGAFSFLCNLRDYIEDLYDELDNIDASKALESLHKHRWRARETLRVQGGYTASSDGEAEELGEDYEDYGSGSEAGQSASTTIPRLKGTQQAVARQSDRPRGLIAVLKQWVKDLIFYYLGVLVGIVHDRLGRV